VYRRYAIAIENDLAEGVASSPRCIKPWGNSRILAEF
jgi:hypothetical protein